MIVNMVDFIQHTITVVDRCMMVQHNGDSTMCANCVGDSYGAWHVMCSDW